jgi:predicted N-acetyltransferase YhbS
VELGLGFARRDEVPAFLETARPGNVGYYERLGFRVVADEHAPGGGPRLWFMRSDP